MKLFVGFYYYSNDIVVFERLFARSAKKLPFFGRLQPKPCKKSPPPPELVSARQFAGAELN
jgi:hypothetical protein